VLGKAIKRANAQLAADGQTPLPEGLTLHALRLTCASLLVALGKGPCYVMSQLGHTNPTVTLGIYAQAMTSSDDDRERLRLLIRAMIWQEMAGALCLYAYLSASAILGTADAIARISSEWRRWASSLESVAVATASAEAVVRSRPICSP